MTRELNRILILSACLCSLLVVQTVGAVEKSAKTAAAEAVEALKAYLAMPAEKRPALDEQAFARVPLSRAGAEASEKLLWADHVQHIRQARAGEVRERKLRDGQMEMPFFYETFGTRPAKGRSLYISMHGGGGAPKAINDQQWDNQKRLYRPDEGVYLAPRASTNTWNLWHESHIDRLFGRLIEDLIVFEDVDPNRVYIMGYSAGGDGVYQLAPRMADRLAAAAMMAGHPNDASPLGLRNIGFALQVGGKDGAYNRNKVAAEWGKRLDELQKADPAGYQHLVKIYPDKGHWMDREDAMAVPWMSKFTRDPLPRRVVWKQASTTHARFYWLAVDAEQSKPGYEVVATYEGQQATIQSKDVTRLKIRFNDRMLDLDKPIEVRWEKQSVFQGKIPRTIAVLSRTLEEHGDPAAVFSSEVEVRAPDRKQ